MGMEKIIVLAPHTDDLEMGCGGTIAKLAEEGFEVTEIAFSFCGKEELKIECNTAAKILGVHEVKILDYPVRRLFLYRQEILEYLVAMRNLSQPDIVFCPCSGDTHQDHNTIYNEAIRAFKFSKILGYELPWNNIDRKNTCSVSLSEIHAETKILATKEYKSQQHRPYFNENYLRASMLAKGIENGNEYSETFEVIKWRL